MLMKLQRNMQELRDEFQREITEMKKQWKDLRADWMRWKRLLMDWKPENRNTEKLRQRDIKGSLGMKEYEENYVINPKRTIFAL